MEVFWNDRVGGMHVMAEILRVEWQRSSLRHFSAVLWGVKCTMTYLCMHLCFQRSGAMDMVLVRSHTRGD